MTKELDKIKELQSQVTKARAELRTLKSVAGLTPAKNYTHKEIEQIKAVPLPFNLEKAKKLGKKLNRSHRSIISKVKDLGIRYEAVPRVYNALPHVNKTALVNDILKSIGMRQGKKDYFTRTALLELHKRLVE